MHLLVFAEKLPPVADAETLCTVKFLRGCVNAGHEVSVITWVKCTHDGESFLQENIGDIHVVNVPEPRDTGMLENTGRVLRWNWAAYRKACELAHGHKVDFFMTRHEIYRTIPLVNLLKRRFNSIPWFPLFNDPSPICMSIPPYAHERPESFGDTIKVRMIRQALKKRASAVLFPSRRLALHMQRVYQIDLSNRTIIIPHIGARPHFTVERVSNRKQILHSGWLTKGRGGFRAIETLRRVLKAASEDGFDITFTFTGRTDKANYISTELKEFGSMVNITEPVSYDQSLAQIQNADALLLIEAEMKEGIFLPSKLADYAVSGKPILMFCPENGEVSDLVGGYAHPGFLGQNPQIAAERMLTFVKKLVQSEDLGKYCFQNPLVFDEKFIIDNFINDITMLP